MLKKILVVIVLFGSLAFFEPTVFNRQIIGGIHLLILALIAVFTLLHIIYDKSPKIRPGFNVELVLIILAVGLSCFSAYVYHDQDFIITLYAQRSIYFILFYYFLHQIKPEPAFLMRLIMVIGIIWAILYLIQWVAYPTHLFGDKIFKDRNTIRLSFPGIIFAVTAYYLSLLKFLKTDQYKYLFLLVLLFCVFILMGSRQLIGPVMLITLFIVIKSKRIRSKFILAFLIMICAVPIYFIFQDIFMAMIEVTRQQSVNISENVRIKAASFYLYRFAPNNVSFFTGNGAYSAHSSYGILMDNYSRIFGYYLADIGIIGDFILYGIIFVIAELIVLFRLGFKRYPEDYEFMRYFAYSVFFALFTGSGLFGSPEGIMVFCQLMYFTDVIAFKQRQHQADKSTAQPLIT